jgi:hypothetical protein
MPSTFTSNGGIELPADGEKDGVWGDVVNLNMQIVDRLTNGVGAVSLTGTTHDLITANGVLSDGQYGLVVFGGSPSGTNTVTFVPNDSEKIFFIRNTTAESVIMTQGSGGDVTIPAGAGAIVYANGAGIGAAVADLTATFTVSLTQAGVTASASELNTLVGITATVDDLNILDGVTASTDEINHLVGVSGPLQIQLDAKQATINVTTDRALVSDESGAVAASAVTAAELAVLDGITASTAELNLLDGVPLTTDLSYVDGVTSAIQTQLNAKASSASPVFTGSITEQTGTMPTGTTPAINPVNGTVQEWTLSGDSSPTDSLADGEFVELLIQDGTDYTIIWPTITWLTDDASAPTLNLTTVTPVLVQKVGSTLYGRRTGDGG